MTSIIHDFPDIAARVNRAKKPEPVAVTYEDLSQMTKEQKVEFIEAWNLKEINKLLVLTS